MADKFAQIWKNNWYSLDIELDSHHKTNPIYSAIQTWQTNIILLKVQTFARGYIDLSHKLLKKGRAPYYA
jgi:hypothetical protein